MPIPTRTTLDIQPHPDSWVLSGGEYIHSRGYRIRWDGHGWQIMNPEGHGSAYSFTDLQDAMRHAHGIIEREVYYRWPGWTREGEYTTHTSGFQLWWTISNDARWELRDPAGNLIERGHGSYPDAMRRAHGHLPVTLHHPDVWAFLDGGGYLHRPSGWTVVPAQGPDDTSPYWQILDADGFPHDVIQGLQHAMYWVQEAHE